MLLSVTQNLILINVMLIHGEILKIYGSFSIFGQYW